MKAGGGHVIGFTLGEAKTREATYAADGRVQAITHTCNTRVWRLKFQQWNIMVDRIGKMYVYIAFQLLLPSKDSVQNIRWLRVRVTYPRIIE